MAKSAQSNGKSLVIVESPSKARTINKYLGDDYHVMASMGHVRDLPLHDFGLDPENNFEPIYQVLDDKKKIVSSLKKASNDAPTVFLATDPDREGEAIAWHLLHALELPNDQAKRVVFNEITKSAITQAFAAAHSLDMDKVNAQQARRLLDRIVGYQLSPLLQRKIGKGLSAGRVQSVAVRLIVEREREIRAFIPEESWKLTGIFTTQLDQSDKLSAQWAKFLAGGKSGDNGRTLKERNKWLSKHECMQAELIKLAGKECKLKEVGDAREIAELMGFKVDKVSERPHEEYEEKNIKRVELVGALDVSALPKFAVREIKKRRSSSRPNPPFTTAALQQAASSMLGFGPSRTMRIAQQLYEGVDLGGGDGHVGLITYMRTDSVNLSKESVSSVRDWINDKYGDKYLPEKPNYFAKAKRAQEAHEAIRPTEVWRKPEDLKSKLTRDQHKLYDLIWRRFVACQMTPAQWDSTTVHIGVDTPKGEALFRASGRQLAFDGFLKVMRTASTDDLLLPLLEEGDQVTPLELDPKQVFTSPPSRYSEASLVKKLEAEGIGRPSTYAAIIQTIQDRSYVELLEKALWPTARGELVTDKLVEHFPRIMDVKFTSYMEDELDKIEDSHLDWVHVLNEFYEPFREALQSAQSEMEQARSQPSEYKCPECGRGMVYRFGKNGRFLACSGYPECTATMNVDREGKPVEDKVVDHMCPDCGKPMTLKKSRRGPFLGCSNYPNCTATLPCDEEGVPLRKVEADEIQERCDACGSQMEVKFSRGRSFLGCTSYPKCKETKPLPAGVYVEKPKPEEAGVRCDKCGRDMVIRRGRRGPFLSCSGFPRCKNAMPLDKLEHLKELEREGKIPEKPKEPAGGGKSTRTKIKVDVPRTKDGKIDYEAMGPAPAGFEWTRTGRPVVENWPEDKLLCPNCGTEMAMKTGRFGPYFGCTAYPKCDFVANLRGPAKKKAEADNPAPPKPKPIPTNLNCEECGEKMVIRTGRTGPFLGCSKYPKCKATQPIPDGESVESLTAK